MDRSSTNSCPSSRLRHRTTGPPELLRRVVSDPDGNNVDGSEPSGRVTVRVGSPALGATRASQRCRALWDTVDARVRRADRRFGRGCRAARGSRCTYRDSAGREDSLAPGVTNAGPTEQRRRCVDLVDVACVARGRPGPPRRPTARWEDRSPHPCPAPCRRSVEGVGLSPVRRAGVRGGRHAVQWREQLPRPVVAKSCNRPRFPILGREVPRSCRWRSISGIPAWTQCPLRTLR